MALEGLDFEFDLAPPAATEDLTAGKVRQLALQGRADILGALADYAASQSALQLEVAKQYPDIHLAPGYYWNAGSAGEHDWQIGATVELPILNRTKDQSLRPLPAAKPAPRGSWLCKPRSSPRLTAP